MLGEKVTLGQSLMITVFSMVIVFLTLLIISYLIKGLQSFSQKEKKEKVVENIDSVETKEEIKEVEGIEDGENSEELVAVIAAAIAASIGVDVSDVKINNIKRVPQRIPEWSKVGRKEQIFNRL